MLLTRRAASLSIGALLLLGLADAARAHDAEKGPNGGPMIETKGMHLELLVRDANLVVVLSDASHAPLASKGASGRAVILEGSGQRTVPLAPAEPDRLTARLEKPLASGARVVVSAKLASGQDLLARFVVK